MLSICYTQLFLQTQGESVFRLHNVNIVGCVDGKHSHLDLTHATGCKHPRLRFLQTVYRPVTSGYC
jgi:hypothetical protein